MKMRCVYVIILCTRYPLLDVHSVYSYIVKLAGTHTERQRSSKLRAINIRKYIFAVLYVFIWKIYARESNEK